MILKKFIDLGWHTVPLEGELKRLENGKKTTPRFPKDYLNYYLDNFNEQVSELAGAIPGPLSDFLAIDCDNQQTYDMFRSLDPDYDFTFESVGKPEGGGTIIYKYEEINSFSINQSFKLDFISSKKIVYLPTEKNFTKKSWADKEFPTIKKMPDVVKSLVKSLHSPVQVKPQSIDTYSMSNRLYPVVNAFLNDYKQEQEIKANDHNHVISYNQTVLKSFFKVITPKSFRLNSQYVEEGYLHPNNIEGSGSEYLVKISAILGADISISPTTYYETMLAVNGLWDKPMSIDRLKKEIIDPMINSRSTINGAPIWKYDKDWDKRGLSAINKLGELTETFFDERLGLYFRVNYANGNIAKYKNKTQCISLLRTVTGKKITEVFFDGQISNLRTVSKPNKDFGNIGNNEFNLFMQTDYLNCINNPDIYADKYSYPEITLKYLETFVPHEATREYLLRFLKTKFTTFEHSPIILYFLGAIGSGKDTFVKLLSRIVGDDRVAPNVKVKVFTEQYNDWMQDKLFIHGNEYGNYVNRTNRDELMGTLKSLSGSEKFQVRPMFGTAFTATHNITVILTSNRNPLNIESEDRRFLFLKTPTSLVNAEWIKEYGGVTSVLKRIEEETMDFCYYLATEKEILTGDEYNKPPFDQEKDDIIFESLPVNFKLAELAVKNDFDKLKELADEYQVNEFTDHWQDNKLMRIKLEELYQKMSNGKDPEFIQKAMRERGFKTERSTFKGYTPGAGSAYYYIEGLRNFKNTFKPEQGDNLDLSL